MNKAIFVDLLKKKIKEKGYGQEEFSEAIGIGYSTLKKYISTKNDVMPDTNILIKMCDELECDPDYLLGRISCTTHEMQLVYDTIGLTESSFNYLKKLKDNINPDDDLKLSTLNQILVTDEFDKLLYYLTYARHANTGFQIKYNNSLFGKELSTQQKSIMIDAYARNENYVDSKEYHASKELGKLFDKIISIPIEDNLMLYDYLDFYFEMFGENFPIEQFSSNEDASIQIKQCLITNTPLMNKKG